MDITDKDVYETIVHSSDDRTVLEMLSVNKKFNQDDAFRRVLERRYPYLIAFRKEGETWKALYLRMIYYIEKLKEKFDFPYINYKEFNPDSEYKKYIKYKHVDIKELGLRHAVRANRLDLVQYFLNLGAKNISEAYGIAVSLHNLELMRLFESLTENISYNSALIWAAIGNHFDLVKFLINEKGANDYNFAMAKTGSLDIIKYLIDEKGANDFDRGLTNSGEKNNWKELADYFIEKGANDFNRAFDRSAFYANIDMMKYLVDKGANGFRDALSTAINSGKLDVVKYIIDTMEQKNIPINFNSVMRDILKNKRENFEVIKYFIDTFPERLDLEFLSHVAKRNDKNNLYNYLISKI